ncbi:MAG: LysM peptidoglycan-binding domain-containing protein [Phycisphaeraceae bacterium]|nr:LysM peptidoglycan-binding domain-containing protein [Phycisphaeraceae bacterium]
MNKIKNPYNLALALTVVLCVLIVGYHFLFFRDAIPTTGQALTRTDQSLPASNTLGGTSGGASGGGGTASAGATSGGGETTTLGSPAARPSLRTDGAEPVRTWSTGVATGTGGGVQSPAIGGTAGTGQAGAGEATAYNRGPGSAIGSSGSGVGRPVSGVSVPATQPGMGASAGSVSVRPAADTAPRQRTYTIRKGDTFSSISVALYKTKRYTDEIAQANPFVDPVKLKIGQVIRLPDIATNSPKATVSAMSTAAVSLPAGPPVAAQPTAPGTGGSAAGGVHVVKSSETLWAIAAQHYGNGGLWRTIYQANKSTIGSKPDRVKAGMKLVIPPAPAGKK